MDLRRKVELFTRDAVANNLEATYHKDYDEFQKEIEEAFQFLEKFKNTTSKLEKSAMESTVKVAQEVLNSAKEKTKKMHNEVLEDKIAYKKYDASIHKKVEAIMKKADIIQKANVLLQTINDSRKEFGELKRTEIFEYKYMDKSYASKIISIDFSVHTIREIERALSDAERYLQPYIEQR